jgi:probable LLM family oxidoreductase
MTQDPELGLDTFGDITRNEEDQPKSHAQVIRDVIEEAVLADRLGVDSIGLGEHHRDDFSISAPDVVGAAIAARTERIRIGSSVTVLSTDDPVRVLERWSTVDAVSGGRAEVILGRGSFTESYSLFGYSLDNYEALFEEKLDLFTALLGNGPVDWSGTVRPPVKVDRVYPPPESAPLRVWVGVGGSPESVVRAARYGHPLILAIIGGDPTRFAPLVDLYHRALEHFGKPRLPIGVHSPGYIAATDAQARDELWPHYRAMHARIGRERGWPPMTRAQFDSEAGPNGALFAGSPETVAAKISKVVEALGLSRFSLKYSNGALPHEQALSCIELYATQVIPAVRERVAAS